MRIIVFLFNLIVLGFSTLELVTYIIGIFLFPEMFEGVEFATAALILVLASCAIASTLNALCFLKKINIPHRSWANLIAAGATIAFTTVRFSYALEDVSYYLIGSIAVTLNAILNFVYWKGEERGK